MKKLLLLLPAFLLLCIASMGQTTYTWIGADNASWQVAANWTPERTTPASNDILQFNDGTTKTVTAVPAQTVGRLLVIANTNITLQAAAANNVLTISDGTTIVDLEVGAGSQLNVSGASALSISLPTGATGSISGSMSFTAAAHRLLALAANAITFHSGASFTAGTGFSGNAFGNAAANTNSIVFSSGSTYTHEAGSHPFGRAEPNSVVVFQTGSLFRLTGTVAPAFSGRTYANFESNRTGTVTVTGTGAVSIDNFTVAQGTFNFNMTGVPGHSIRGNITVATGAILNFIPASDGTVNLNGTALQTIAGGGTITANTFSTLATSNTSGVRLDQAAQLHNLTISSGIFEVAAAGQARINGTLTNNAGAGGLVLRSGASLLHNTAGVAATMERVFSGVAQWRLVSSPVAGQAISGPWTPATPGYDFYAWDEPASTWRNQKEVANTINNFVPGVGYLVSFQAADLTQSFAGALNNGDVTVPVTRRNTGAHRGANLLGNPYPSSIDWNLAVRDPLFADDFAYIYDPLFGTGGGYVTVNGAAAGALIAPNQGFFVIMRVQGDSSSFTFTNAMRTHGGVFKSAAANPTISITLQQGAFYDRAQIVQLQDATTARERSDALKFFSYNLMMPQVFSMSSDAVQLAVNSTAPITEDASFAIGVLTPVTGNYTLQVEGLQEILAGRPAFLLDRVTGTSHNLRDQTGISFHAVQSSTAVERFVLSFVQPTGVGNNLPEDATVIYFANGMLYMQFAAEESNRQLQVIDLSGRVVLSKSLRGMGNMVSVPLQLDNGAYIVRITGEASAVNRRIWVR